MNLFLDDIRTPESVSNYIISPLKSMYRLEHWEIVRNYDEFVKWIEENGLPEKISFDHDLADVHYDPTTWVEGFEYLEKTGLDCAKWLVDYCIQNDKVLPSYFIHSQNTVGSSNIKNYLENYKKIKNY